MIQDLSHEELRAFSLKIKSMDRNLRFKLLETLDPDEMEQILYCWDIWARESQLIPPELIDPASPKDTLLLLGSRGAGKTRVGSESIRKLVCGSTPLSAGMYSAVGLIGENASDARDVMIEGSALDLETLIPTPDGFRKIRDINVGDKVYNKFGIITTVIATQEFKNRPCYKMTFKDSECSVIADANHMWDVSDYLTRRTKSKNKILTTKELTKITIQNQYNYRLPKRMALQNPASNDLEIPPFTYGAWLGDGAKRDATFTQHPCDSEVLDRIEEDGFVITDRVGYYEWGITEGFNSLLTKYKLKKNKRILPEVFNCSYEYRLEMFRGLMDTDGTVSERGQCEFDQIDYDLIKDVRRLALTLGYKVGKLQIRYYPDRYINITGKNYKTSDYSYRFCFTCHKHNPNPFNIKRKYNRVVYSTYTPEISITSVEPCKNHDVKCIQVDSECGTFLCSEDYFVTHNSGLLSVHPKDFRPTYKKSQGKLEWPNGAFALVRNDTAPENIRGLNSECVWVDEFAKFKNAQETYDQINMSTRVGRKPIQIYTTTPRTTKILRQIRDDERTIHVSQTIFDNAENLAPGFVKAVMDRYEGTRLGRQEIYGELLDDVEGALWTEDMFRTEEFDINEIPSKIVVGVDPSGTRAGDECGIIVAAKHRFENLYYVLYDASIKDSPHEWSRRISAVYERFGADKVVVETNYGAEMVTEIMKQSNPDMIIKTIHSSRGKIIRAEPISALYAQGKVIHRESADLKLLEDEMTTYTGAKSDKSPGRLDACVFALTELRGKTFSDVSSMFDLQLQGFYH